MAKTGSKLISINDEELVKMALDGNQKAFTALHAKYQLAVFLKVIRLNAVMLSVLTVTPQI